MFEAWILEHGEDLQFVLFFLLLGVFGVLERLVPRRTGPMMRKQRWTANFAITAINVVVMGLLPLGFIGSATWAASGGIGLLNATGATLAVAIAVTVLARSFISFSTHWSMHKLPWLWRVHRVHHLDTELDISTTVRFHPAEFVIQLALGLPLVVLFGLSPWVLMVYELADAGVTLFSHANIRLPQAIDRVLHYLIVTPDLHRVHHSTRQPETDSNYGAVFPIWDLIFGTFRAKTLSPRETMPLGLAEVRDHRSSNLWWLLLSPLRSIDAANGDGIAAATFPARKRRDRLTTQTQSSRRHGT